MRSDPTRGIGGRMGVVWLAAALTLVGSTLAHAEIRPLEASDLTVSADTSDTHGVRVALDLMFDGDLARRTLQAIDPFPTFRLVRDGRTLFGGLETEMRKHGIRLVLPLNPETLARFGSFGDLAEAEIRPDQVFTVTLDTLEFLVTPDIVASATHGRWAWATDSLISLWKKLDVVQTGTYLGNFFDAGRRAEKDANGDDIFAARFSFTSPFLLSGNWFHVEGDWSSLPNDSTNRLHLDPINVRIAAFSSRTATLTIRSGVDCGREGFSRQGRFTAGLDWESLVPNLLDLTGGSPRFRLRPIIHASIQGFGEWSDRKIPSRDRDWGQAKLSLDYDVPARARQVLRIEGSAFFPFKSSATRQDLKYNYSLRLFTEVAGGKLQPMLSFTNGADDVNKKKITRFLLGLWFDGVLPSGN